MTISSLSSSTISSLAQYGLTQATNQITSSTYRLSTGDRFYRAGDDVASMSIANRISSDIVGKRQGLLNNTQADSLLQTAYGAASEIQTILEDMKALAVQGNSGALTAAQRSTLDLEFQELKDEIDSLAGSTSFNSVKLLDGSVTGENDVETTTANATQATGAITFTGNPVAGQTIELNGLSLVANTDFTIGGTTNDTATNLANALNLSTDTRVSGATYQAVGSTVNITMDAGGRLGNNYIIDEANSTAAASFVVSGNTTNLANTFTLNNGADDGMFIGSTEIVGTVGDSLVNTLSQTAAEVRISFSGNPADTETIQIDNGDAGLITFNILDTPVGLNDIQRASTLEETLENVVSGIENYRQNTTNNDDYVLNQLEFEIDGNDLLIRNRQPGNVLDLNSGAANIAEGIATASVSAGTFANGTNTGINTSGVVNADFVGTISGFTATYNSADDITASVTVGSETYTAEINDTTPAADTFVRFNSANGGYFDVELDAGSGGLAVTNQADADSYAGRLTAAFAPLTVYQTQQVSNFAASGQLAGGSAQVKTDDFSDFTIGSISVTDSTTGGGDAAINIEVGGETFRTSGLGDSIGADETIRFVSQDNAHRMIELTNGATQIDLATSTDADTFESSLRTNFGLGSGSGSLSFQLGESSSDTLSISIASATSDSLFDGSTPDLLTQTNAASAETVLDGALDEIGGILAQIGADQSRLDYAYNVTSSNITELEQAHSALADTDIPSESSLYAAAVVQQQAAIAVLAQSQLLSGNLVDLLKVG